MTKKRKEKSFLLFAVTFFLHFHVERGVWWGAWSWWALSSTIPLLMPYVQAKGLRPTVLVVGGLVMVGTVLRYLASFSNNSKLFVAR